MFSNGPATGQQLRGTTIGGQRLPITISENMVGHQMAIGGKRNVQNLSQRIAAPGARANKVSNMALARKYKTKLIQGAVILAAISGTLWDIPSKRALNALRSETLNAIWGKGRKMRALEIALSILNDPIRTDRLAAIVYKRLNDARRLLQNSEDRLRKAISAFQLMPPNRTVHSAKEGPIAGLQQASLLLGGTLHADEAGLHINFSHGPLGELPFGKSLPTQ